MRMKPGRAASGRTGKSAARRPAALPQLVALAACAASPVAWALHWPHAHRAGAAASQPVALLEVRMGTAAAAAAAPPSAPLAPAAAPPSARPAPIAQYWDRNTLLVDLTHVAGEGGATLTPVSANGGWPVRLEFRVRPGSVARLQVLGAQRVIFIVPAHGAAEVFKLDPGVYLADTTRITLQWSAAGDLPR